MSSAATKITSLLFRYFKRFLAIMDRRLFNGTIKGSLNASEPEHGLISLRQDVFSYGYRCEYNRPPQSELNRLCQDYGTDKGSLSDANRPYSWPPHNYADIYELLFSPIRHHVKMVLECGIGTNNPDLASSMGEAGIPGASLRVWKAYFPNASIIGIDIDDQILFDEDRIKTFQCDQTDFASIERFAKQARLEPGSIDIVIDDGLHEFEAGKTLFEGLAPSVRDNGTYIIEDVSISTFKQFKEYFADKADEYAVHFLSLKRPGLSIGMNRMIVIRKSVAS